MKMLNYDRKLTEDIIKKGNHILSELKLHHEMLQTTLAEAMGCVTLNFPGDLEQRLE
jgi:hypothetical protein